MPEIKSIYDSQLLDLLFHGAQVHRHGLNFQENFSKSTSGGAVITFSKHVMPILRNLLPWMSEEAKGSSIHQPRCGMRGNYIADNRHGDDEGFCSWSMYEIEGFCERSFEITLTDMYQVLVFLTVLKNLEFLYHCTQLTLTNLAVHLVL
ncbi:PREDICTED: uncharacterized protein LOC109187214 [Ipomoea nil]|uniref:uncharacterized protein LOC109187214 n=1 Tax=Ipomoea nil TaxID=35883 RepID=UPI0009015A36|nr:PREDICTED: uncharacterized protein LOC109187214 [Ipomoea nil]XP_019192912.1 PREDICTED: uncharacterized protein LOC109187214 [Ipomoea nil]XP_019192919.1 PREDICTED: uncharacterized protein LOC109187214 [Ipomoea nil]